MTEPETFPDARPHGASACCGRDRVLEPVWANVRRSAQFDGFGRHQIGDVPVCAKCLRPAGSLRTFKTEPKLTPEAWAHMVRVHAQAPYYFDVDGDGKLSPECSQVWKPRPQTSPHEPEAKPIPLTGADRASGADDDFHEPFVGEEEVK